MKAFYLKSYGGPEASEYGDLPDPIPGKKQLLIEVKAASINPVDYKLKNGDLRFIVGSKFPKVVGTDFSGIVREAGPDAINFKKGDRVYGSVSIIFRKPGSLSELICVNQAKTRKIPDGITFEEAASLPVAALTALNGLRNCRISAGKQVLINGATGGVGHFAVQIAKAMGAHVTATCSQRNVDLAKNLGADEVTGYGSMELEKTGKKFDAILDAYGKMDYSLVCNLLKRNGIYASTLFMPTSIFSAVLVRLIFRKKLTSSNMRSRSGDYDEIEKLILGKKLKPHIENIYPLEKSAEAFHVAEKGKPRGKIVVQI